MQDLKYKSAPDADRTAELFKVVFPLIIYEWQWQVIIQWINYYFWYIFDTKPVYGLLKRMSEEWVD